MYVITARNVNDAYRQGLKYLAAVGKEHDSRNGPVLRAPMPVTTVYQAPIERVLFSEQRDANPFFHLFESLWILNGQNDVETIMQFAPSGFDGFSDDGKFFHGAYGYRLRHWETFAGGGSEMDQLKLAIEMLRRNANDRRVVLSLWDPELDLNRMSNDLPCNDMIKLAIVNGALDIIVFNRSNDIIWGAYGANAVQFSMIHEYLAAMIGVKMGKYLQISTDYHAYLQAPYRWDKFWPIKTETTNESWQNPYGEEFKLFIHPLVTAPLVFDTELATYMNAISMGKTSVIDFKNTFFNDVVRPMHVAHAHVKQNDLKTASDMLQKEILRTNPVLTTDWLFAGYRWCERRLLRQKKKVYSFAKDDIAALTRTAKFLSGKASLTGPEMMDYSVRLNHIAEEMEIK